eukprot:4135033-Lingulodinium_polyedra.AAC.1
MTGFPTALVRGVEHGAPAAAAAVAPFWSFGPPGLLFGFLRLLLLRRLWAGSIRKVAARAGGAGPRCYA